MELSLARSARRGAPWITKFGYHVSVRPSVRPQAYLFRYFIYLPHDYDNYKKMPKKKKCRKRWRGGLKETIELMLIRPPQLQFFEDSIKITATDTI